MKKVISFIVGIFEGLKLGYYVTKRLLEESVKWYDLGISILLLYGLGEINSLFPSLPSEHQDVLRGFIEWYAVFYAVALGVILAEAWRRHNQINRDIDREADSLKLMLQTSRLFPNKKLHDRLVVKAFAYANTVQNLKFKDKRTKSKSYRRLQSTRKSVDKLIASDTDSVQEFLKADLLSHYCDVYDARGDRFDQFDQRLTKYVWFLLGLFSLIWLWGFFWLEFHPDCLGLKRYILGSTILSISLLFYTARSLNDPTKPLWKISFDSFKTIVLETDV